MIHTKDFTQMVDDILDRTSKELNGWRPFTHASLPFIRAFARLLAIRVLEDFRDGIVATGPSVSTGEAVKSLVNQCIKTKYSPLIWAIQLSDGTTVEARKDTAYAGGVVLVRTPAPPSDPYRGYHSIEVWQRILTERFDSGEDFVLLRDFVNNTVIET